MTISDLIARLTRIMKETTPTTQVKLGRTYNSTENPFDAFEVRKPMECNEVYLVPSDVWIRTDLKRTTVSEAQR